MGIPFTAHVRATTYADIQAPFTFSLAATFVGDESESAGDIKYTRSAKTITVRVTERDVLDSLITDNKIARPLTGWRLVARASLPRANDLCYQIYAVKLGQPDYLVTFNGKSTFDFDVGKPVQAYKQLIDESVNYYTGSGTTKYAAFGYLNLYDQDMRLGGIATTTFLFSHFGSGMNVTTLTVPKTTVFSVRGDASFYDYDLGLVDLVLDGTIKFGASIVTPNYVP